jgi:RecA-family ATPase
MTFDSFEDVERHLERDSDEYFGRGRRQTLPLFDLALLDGAPPAPREWILPGFIPAGEITLFTGPGGAGKSLFAQQLVACLAAGSPFLGLPTVATRAIYVTAEDDTNELHRRQLNIERAIGQLSRRRDNLFLASLRGRDGNELVTFDRNGEMEHGRTFTLLRDTIAETGATVLVLDNLAHLFAGNENDRGQVTRFVNALYSLPKRVVQDCGVDCDSLTILLVGHPNKSGDSYSGSTAWLNAVRSQIDISRVTDEIGNVLDADARVLRLGKANYARHGQVHHFRWHDFAFYRDDDLPADTRREYDELALADGESAAFLRCLAAATARRKAVSDTSGTNYYASVFAKMPEGRGYGKAAFERALQRLLAMGEIELDAKLWQRENRAWKYGIRAVDKPAEKCTDHLHRPPAPNCTDLSVNPARTDHPSTTYYQGAASRPAAPDDDDLDWSDGDV